MFSYWKTNENVTKSEQKKFIQENKKNNLDYSHIREKSEFQYLELIIDEQYC